MIGFHIDMNVVQYKGDYLKKWLRHLSKIGYDTIIWEVENNVQWETCPECVSPDAFSKFEFKEILDYSLSLGLEPIPLFQTIGHCEYVLKHKKFKYLAELDGNISQYCPRKPEVIDFIHSWIEEYISVFKGIRYFHIGADEAYSLGKCDSCAKFVTDHSLSELFITYINKVAEPIYSRNIVPIIWGDMIFKHHEALEKLSRKIMVFDWMYDVYCGDGEVWVWGKRKQNRHKLSKNTLGRFKDYLFPNGDEPGAIPETFYTADFLSDQGFQTVTCPGSSSSGDNVFSPRNLYHMRNTYDSMHKGLCNHLQGVVLTSWSVHLFPWELQLACIAMPKYIKMNPDASLDKYKKWFAKQYFNLDSGTEFWKACGLLSKSCLFTYTKSLGFNKSTQPVEKEYIDRQIEKAAEDGKIECELQNCRKRLEEYEEALVIFEKLSQQLTKNNDLIYFWELAARNLINRAKASIYLLEKKAGYSNLNGQNILKDMKKLRMKTEKMYEDIVKPTRRNEILGWIFDSMAYCLEQRL